MKFWATLDLIASVLSLFGFTLAGWRIFWIVWPQDANMACMSALMTWVALGWALSWFADRFSNFVATFEGEPK